MMGAVMEVTPNAGVTSAWLFPMTTTMYEVTHTCGERRASW